MMKSMLLCGLLAIAAPALAGESPNVESTCLATTSGNCLTQLASGPTATKTPSSAYSYSFWVKPTRTNKGWSSALQAVDASMPPIELAASEMSVAAKDGGPPVHARHRNPAVWFYPGSTRLHIRSGTRASWNDGRRDPTPTLRLSKWTHVAVVHSGGRLSVFYDGNQVATGASPGPVGAGGPIYAGDPWSAMGGAELSGFSATSTALSAAQVKAAAKVQPVSAPETKATAAPSKLMVK
ncbi:MAG: hypothetical protein ACI9MR_004328 [Myxococcota bacterium]|jgi:hypothetical protein